MCSLTSNSKLHYSAKELLQIRSTLPPIKSLPDNLNTLLGITCIARQPGVNTYSSRHSARKHNTDCSGESENMAGRSRRAGHDYRQRHWHLRRRASSDRSSQPYSAPADMAAQQSENFQRFYRAVVSPTHVRVTAGGRIVPNTRVTGPPAFDLNPEKLTFDAGPASHGMEGNGSQPIAFLHSPPALPGHPPLVPNGFLSPLTFLPRAGSFALPTMPPQTGSSAGKNQNDFNHSQGYKPNADTFGSSQQPGGLLHPLNMSPTTPRYDPSKPVVYNNQLVYPLTPIPNPLPIGPTMVGNPNFLHQGLPSPMPSFGPMPHFPIPLTPVPNPLALNSGQQLPMPLPPVMFPFNSPALGRMPALSEITKSQIQGLRTHLGVIDNQLTNNKHQIDDSFMQLQHNAVLAQISHMESMLEAQLALENDTTADLQEDNNANRTQAFTAQDHHTPTFKSPSQNSSAPSKQSPHVPTDNNLGKQVSKTKDAQKENVKQTKPTAGSGSTIKSRLSAAAAMAPPFQPRGQASTTSSPNIQADMGLSALNPPYELMSPETQAESERRLLSKASTIWEGSTRPTRAAADTGPCDLTQTWDNRDAIDGVQQPSMLHEPMDPSAFIQAPPVLTQSVPYLVGTLPQDIPNNEANATDLVYSRPLTDEEIRARYLYWGRAPRSVQKGLPKFDGKDFYPPSPVRELAHTTSGNEDGAVSPYRGALSVPLPNFAKLFAEPDAAGYMSPSPIRSSKSYLSPSGTPVKHYADDSGLGILIADDSATFSGHPHREERSYHPGAPSHASFDTGISKSDFSQLFLGRGVPGYRSPSVGCPRSIETNPTPNYGRSGLPVGRNAEASDEVGASDDETRSIYSWGTSVINSRRGLGNRNTSTTMEEVDDEERSESSTVEIHLTARPKTLHPKPNAKINTSERGAAFSSADQQTLFLQNMLRNVETTRTMAGSALSGTVSSTNATGYLPQYRGSAAASLAPTILNVSGNEQTGERRYTKNDLSMGLARARADLLAENNPLTRERSQPPSRHHSAESMSAEEYLLLLSRQPEKRKQRSEYGWNANITGRGRGMDADW